MSAESLRVVEGDRAPRGWEALWPRDVWFQSELPHGDLASRYRGEETLRFERIAQSWLKEAAKRWARMRLLADTIRTAEGKLALDIYRTCSATTSARAWSTTTSR